MHPWFIATEALRPDGGDTWTKYIEWSGLSQLQVFRNPSLHLEPLSGRIAFEFLGYDLVETETATSALTNCGGFPKAFSNNELNSKGLLNSHSRAIEVQADLRVR